MADHTSSVIYRYPIPLFSHASISSTSASLSPVSPPNDIFALPAEIFLDNALYKFTYLLTLHWYRKSTEMQGSYAAVPKCRSQTHNLLITCAIKTSIHKWM